MPKKISSKNLFTQSLQVVGASLLSVLIFFAIAEIASRAWLFQQVGGERFWIEWFKRGRIVGIHEPREGVINELGFHNEPRQPIKGKNIFRVLILGGSAAYGTDRIHTNWGAELEKILNDSSTGIHYEVWNSGISGAASHEELETLRNIIELDPDVMVVYDGFNDIYASHYSSDGYKSRAPDYGMNGDVVLLKNFLARHSFAFVLLDSTSRRIKKAMKEKRKKTIAPPIQEKTEPVPPKAPAAADDEKKVLNIWNANYEYAIDQTRPVEDHFSAFYEKNLYEMHRIASRRGVLALFILQPNLAYSASRKTLSPEAQEVLKRSTNKLNEDWLKASAVLYPKALEVMERLRAKGVMTYDFTNIFEGIEGQGFIDSVHQPEEGFPRQLIAQKIFEILVRQRLLPERRS